MAPLSFSPNQLSCTDSVNGNNRHPISDKRHSKAGGRRRKRLNLRHSSPPRPEDTSRAVPTAEDESLRADPDSSNGPLLLLRRDADDCSTAASTADSFIASASTPASLSPGSGAAPKSGRRTLLPTTLVTSSLAFLLLVSFGYVQSAAECMGKPRLNTITYGSRLDFQTTRNLHYVFQKTVKSRPNRGQKKGSIASKVN